MEQSLFFQAFIYLLAAVISVPLAKRIGLGSVLGYLLAGIIIGPYVLGFVGRNTHDVMQFAEFGIVMMLFLIGLELQPNLLWQLRLQIFGMGSLQIILTTLALSLIGLGFGLSIANACTIGAILSLSSTAIVMQTLSEKGRTTSTGGRSAFSILLLQDIAVIPMIAIFSLLANKTTNTSNLSPFSALHGWQKGLLIVSVVVGIILAGRFLIRPLFRFIAATKLRESFTAVALLIVVGITLAMQAVGLSPALGTFLAGVVLAESEYRHELESDIEPFKGLLLGLFFISIGASVDFQLILSHLKLILGLVGLLVSIKFIVLLTIGKFFKMPSRDNLLTSLALLQGGEFCFVLLAYTARNNILSPTIVDYLIAVVALSMMLTPLFFIIYEKLIEPRLIEPTNKNPADKIDENNPVVIAGFGRFGQIVGRFLTANGISSTVLDLDANHIELVRRYGFKVFYGDASRLELLNAAKLQQAKLLVLAIDDSAKALTIAKAVRKNYSTLPILIRAKGRNEALAFIRAGFDNIYRETFDASLNMAIDALVSLGIDREKANRAAVIFKKHDEVTLRKFVNFSGNEKDYIGEMRKSRALLEEVLATDIKDNSVGRTEFF